MITLDRKQFYEVLDRVNRIAKQKSPIPHVGHIKIVFADDKLTYSATDLSTSLIGSMPGKGNPESFTVNAQDLGTYVKNTVGDTVKLSLDSKTSRLTVTGEGKRKFTSPTLPADEFPAIVYDSAAPVVNVPAESLRAALTKVQFAIASYKDARNGTDCVKIDITDGMLSAVAANGHVLAQVQDAIEVVGSISAILPRGAVSSVLALTAETIGVYVTENEIGFKTENEVLIERATTTQFPAFQNALDSIKPKKSSMVSSETILGSLTAIRGADSAKNVSITFRETELEIEGGSEGGDKHATDIVPAAGDNSSTITIAADYLTGALKGFANASFGFDGDSDPVTISDGLFLVVIMPII